MSIPFYSDESEPIHRRIVESDEFASETFLTVAVNFEIERCVKWISHHNFSKVALQFPDCLLKKAAQVALELAARTEKQFFVLADTSYGSCCVDEIAAEHVSADSIIHFGHSCLSLTQRLPVLYIFGEGSIDVPDTVTAFKKIFPDVTSHIIIYYEVFYCYAVGQIIENLKEYEHLVVSELIIPHEECKTTLNDNQVKITKCQRCFIIPKTKELKEYSIFYIGCHSRTFTNVMLSLSKCKFYLYNPVKKIVQDDTFNINHFLRKRFYYIEKTRDANRIGILVGTLGVSNYVCTIKQLREAISAAGKKSYVIVVGKCNVAKLANFAEIEVFVNVACFESSIVDCSGFYQPIITPYELEIALNIREWSDDYVTDFAELLPDGAKYTSLNNMKCEADVSLITGKTRSIGLNSVSEERTSEASALVQRDEMAISTIHHQAAGEFLSQRHWKGLEQHLGETPVSDIQQGKKGIACEYQDEGKE